MDSFDSARQVARELRQRIDRAEPVTTSMELVAAACRALDVELYFRAASDPLLKGARAIFDAQARLICCAQERPLVERGTLVAHELGHVCLDSTSSTCSEDDLDVARPEEVAPVGLQRVEDYGQRERRELLANVFAREFLLPRPEARRLYLAEGLDTLAISERTQVPQALVRQQLLDGLLLPVPTRDVEQLRPLLPCDASQEEAAVHRGSAYLLQAGPGTGKTHALLRRVTTLLAEGVDAASIAILTFSNRAAGDLHERLARAHPDASTSIWIGTFHAFGLDLVRRYHDRLGLPSSPTLFDRSDGIALLEEELPTLGLKQYRDLWNPARELRNMLVAISRAKDELVDADLYRKLADDMVAAASDEGQVRSAEKAREVAIVYARYQALIRERGGVDFGDLIMLPARLLENDAPVRSAVSLRHRHLLVDEYQDVNRASARLLAAIAGDGKRLWVVGDARQSIYRFRGASAENVKRFSVDYPGSQTSQLQINYRSCSEIVDMLTRASPHMAASRHLLPLRISSNAGPSGRRAEIRRVERPEDELEAIVQAVRDLEKAGVPLCQQAVLCRTNPKVAEVAAALEARGVPVLHLGSIFERDEIRDLLSVLSLVVDRRGDALLRVGRMPRYALSAADVQATLASLREEDSSPAAQRLRALADAAGLSASGRDGLRRLADDLDGFDAGSSPWDVLASFTLDRARVLVETTPSTSIVDQVRALAVWQFLNFARQPVPGHGPRIRRLLNRVRMLVLLAEERDLRRVPNAAQHLDAIRLMTVHASKGLEFDAVHVPGMTKQSFPASRQGDPCPPPRGMGEQDQDPAAAHEEEEQCLFFVAMSRARSHLYLYAAAKQENGNNRSPSPYLEWLEGCTIERKLPRYPNHAATAEIVDVAWPTKLRLSHHALKTYKRCPRRFLYTDVLGTGTAKGPTAYSKTQSCLYELIEWAGEQRASRVVTEEEMLAKFAEVWVRLGPTDHAFAADYQRIGERLVRALAASGEGLHFETPRVLSIEFGTTTVDVVADELAVAADGALVLRRVRPGYRRSEEKGVDYELLDLAGARAGSSKYVVEAVHLTDGIREPIETTPKQRANAESRAAAAITQIRSGNLPPSVDAYNCPQCPHFFVCPSIPTGTVMPKLEEK